LTKILTIILSVKIVLTLCVKLPCRKCKILNVREIFVLSFIVSEKKKRCTIHWRFGLKIREQFTVSAFSLTVWQTSLHILMNVYWIKYVLIQTDATNDTMAWLITESIRCIPYIYLFNAAKCIVYISTTICPKTIRIFFLILDFKQGTVDNWKDYLQTWGEFFFFIIFFFVKTGIRDFLLDTYSAYKTFVCTAVIGLEVYGSNNIVSILPLY
jgi:hypothetical protein